MKISQYIIHRFWLRNSLTFIFFFALALALYQNTKPSDYIKAFVLSFSLYCYITINNTILIEKVRKKYGILAYVSGLLILFAIHLSVMLLVFSTGKFETVFIFSFLVFVFNIVMGVIAYFALKYLLEQQKFLKNQVYLFEMEQKYLKNQLSPHFIFNTLNNIYYYSLEESKRTPELILKLSELIRFLNEFNKKPKITLKEELSFLDSYLLFERERLEDRCEINYQCEISKPSRAIEPLLFFPLIENAFKHGTNTMEKCFVNIKVKEVNDTFNVVIENRILNAGIVSTHTGKENVQRRLNLFYPNKHSLLVTKENGIYKVDLKIELRNEFIDI